MFFKCTLPLLLYSVRGLERSEPATQHPADLMATQGAFGTDFYDTMLWTEYRPVIKIGPKDALGCHEIRPIHSAPSLGQSIVVQGIRSSLKKLDMWEEDEDVDI